MHASDLHLGYSQYGLEARRQDFNNAFAELVDKTIELKPDFMIIAGDLFHQARPSNITLENTVRSFKRLRDASIPVLTVDGSHDSAPNIITGTILYPLDSAGLIYHLPRHEGACWQKPDCCYVYGIPNFRTRRKTEEELPVFMSQNQPNPRSTVANIFVMHMAVDLPGIMPPYIEAEAPAELLPNGFDYYAAGHVHESFISKFKTGLLAYSGCTETVSYDESKNKKGFFHLKVSAKGDLSHSFIELESPRKFVIIEQDFSGMPLAKIADLAAQLVKGVQEEGTIIVPILKGALPAEANRAELDVSKIRHASENALIVHPIINLRESAVSDEVVRSIFESEFKDLKTKTLEYFFQIFSERFGAIEAEYLARSAISLMEPLIKKQEDKTKQTIEELLK